MVSERQSLDTSLLVATAILVACGILFIYDASFVRASQTHYTNFDPEFYLKRQFVWACVGTVALITAIAVPYWKLDRLAVAGMAITIGLLILVLFAGHESHGSRRWFILGPLRIQPAEFAKIAVVLYLAQWMSVRKQKIRSLTEGFLPLAGLLGLLGVLVAIEPDLGTALVIVCTGTVMLFVGGARKRHLLMLGLVGVLAVVVLIWMEPYRWDRVLDWLNPERDVQGSGYQVVQSLIALGSGGLVGVGLGQGRQKYFYLPAEHTDYILGTIGEELGFLGTMGLLFLFLYVAVRGFTIAHRTKDPFGSLIASGITTMITGQALLNIGVVTKTLPATGVPLPFISYGGSSLVLTMIAMGLLANISQYPGGSPSAARGNKGSNEDLLDRRWDRRARLSSYRHR
ncbi:MAG TPA: putative lipid II flippase FtsW [Armatimonadota bacterium]|nr:putative lipid II flippase FtsW [Armatimonadota bacterium]HPT97328.1 putative lipid II flippase FtsW [Armatimonadota bacterium]